MILLIGNYPFDRQESMLRFSSMLHRELKKRNVEVELIFPRPFFGRLRESSTGLGKWLGYIDKFLIFPFLLRKRLPHCDLVHICDHSNALYSRHVRNHPVLATCHDLFAVRGALGEQTDSAPSRTGLVLQHWILEGLKRVDMIACDSTATRQDVERLVTGTSNPIKTKVVFISLNHDYKKLSREETLARLRRFTDIDLTRPFLLQVGSNSLRKNRAGVLRIFAKLRPNWDGQLVFAGEALPGELVDLSRTLAVNDRVIQLVKPDNDAIEALYNGAFALLFPSRLEGFGWPVIEAQVCGCPVVCSDSPCLPEIAGEGAFMRDVSDEAGFCEAIRRLSEPDERQRLIERGFANAGRFSAESMIRGYLQCYDELAELGKKAR